MLQFLVISSRLCDDMAKYGATEAPSSGAGASVPSSPTVLALLTAGLLATAMVGTALSSPQAPGRSSPALAFAGGTKGVPPSLCASAHAYAAREEMCNAPTAPALGGADVVAYRGLAWSAEDGSREPHVQGDAALAAAVGGFTFWFSTAANRDAFLADPSAYAPALGGFCAFGLTGADPRNLHPQLATLYTMPVDPDVWWLDAAQRLYTFRGPEAMRLFLAASDDNAGRAEANWRSLAVGPKAACADAPLFNTQCFRGDDDASARAVAPS